MKIETKKYNWRSKKEEWEEISFEEYVLERFEDYSSENVSGELEKTYQKIECLSMICAALMKKVGFTIDEVHDLLGETYGYPKKYKFTK